MSNNENSPWEEVDGMDAYNDIAHSAHEESVEKSNENVSSSVKDVIFAETDLVKRARKLAQAQLIEWPHMKRVAEGLEKPDPKSDANRMIFLHALFDGCSGICPHPYFDTFKTMTVDHNGEPLNELASHAMILGRAMDAVGLKNQSYNQIDETYKRFANSIRRNSLLDNFNIKCSEWDGEERLDDWMIHFFRLKDTTVNRKVVRYFWFSLYNRITNPGCQAPLSIALIGGQDVGKTFFSVMLCRVLMDSERAAPAALNLSDIERNTNDWLRRITGNSVIANIGELRGYKKTDVETFKEFTTRTVDNLHQKFASAMDVLRQWIIIADANSYEGFNRDETGNRRFYPMFVNQIDDVDGQPAWGGPEDGWKADFTNFDKHIWQIMAEVRHHMQKGQHVYDNLVSEVSRLVSAFSREEMEKGRGIIKDETMEFALREIVMGVELRVLDGNKNKGVFMHGGDLLNAWNRTQRGTLNNASCLRVMRVMGWEKTIIGGHGRGYLFRKTQVIHGCKYAAFLGASTWEEKLNADCEKDKIFNEALRRAIQKISPDSSDKF